MVDVPFVVIDSLAIFLVVIPSPWHVAAWNSATCYMMLWTTLGCIIHLVNSIVWYHNLSNPSPIYCDITTKLGVGLSIAIPLSSLCINRRLHKIATMASVAITKAQKRRDVIIDTLIAVLGPIIFMAVHYTMQGHRYDIIEDFGCLPTTYTTAPAYVLVIAPPIVVCSISLVYASLSLRAFIRRRTEFNQMLKSSPTGLNPGRYFRLMALASSELLIGLPASLYFFITNILTAGVAPWISWDDTHANFSHINYFPAYFFKFNRGMQVAYELNRWTFPFIAITFFAFFGVSQEARKNYRRALYTVLKPFGVKEPLGTTSKGTLQKNTLPSSKQLANSTDDVEAVILALPPQYASPSQATCSAWSRSTFDLSPTLCPSATSVDKPGNDDKDGIASSTSPVDVCDAVGDAQLTPLDPHAPSIMYCTPVQPSPFPSALRVHVSTTTETISPENLV